MKTSTFKQEHNVILVQILFYLPASLPCSGVFDTLSAIVECLNVLMKLL